MADFDHVDHTSATKDHPAFVDNSPKRRAGLQHAVGIAAAEACALIGHQTQPPSIFFYISAERFVVHSSLSGAPDDGK